MRASTKTALRGKTYAQNLCCGAIAKGQPIANRYQTHSVCKLLIYIDLLNCFFYRQSGERLDFKGLRATGGNLSTKLSTEKVSFCKALQNQALSALSACSFEEVPTFAYIFEAAQ